MQGPIAPKCPSTIDNIHWFISITTYGTTKSSILSYTTAFTLLVYLDSHYPNQQYYETTVSLILGYNLKPKSLLGLARS